ncbi:invasion associated locus B family protein [Pararhodobacter sp.]|uniref:invasion associated locus B family protein n=1 Tax=Pararhodobacter sp. TaxID=2127056 RepID=UPI002AFF4A6D|nr:invasion associated locus B family protein [Pararhodobacter sp.]
MTLRTALRPLALTAVFCAALPGFAAFAQDTAATEPAATEPAATEPAERQIGEPYVAATHNDWEVLCSVIDANGTTNCEMYQLLRDPTDQPVAEISIAALPLGAEFAAGATITTPLETFLPTGLGWAIDDAEEMRVEQFRVCTVVGCIVRMGISAEEVDTLRAGTNAKIIIAPFVAIDQPVEITVSLSGFTAAYADLQTRLSEAAAASR